VEWEEFVFSVDLRHGRLETLQRTGLLQAEGGAQLYRARRGWGGRYRSFIRTELGVNVFLLKYWFNKNKESEKHVDGRTRPLFSLNGFTPAVLCSDWVKKLVETQTGSWKDHDTAELRREEPRKKKYSDAVNYAVVEFMMDVESAPLLLVLHPSSQVEILLREGGMQQRGGWRERQCLRRQNNGGSIQGSVRQRSELRRCEAWSFPVYIVHLLHEADYLTIVTIQLLKRSQSCLLRLDQVQPRGSVMSPALTEAADCKNKEGKKIMCASNLVCNLKRGRHWWQTRCGAKGEDGRRQGESESSFLRGIPRWRRGRREMRNDKKGGRPGVLLAQNTANPYTHTHTHIHTHILDSSLALACRYDATLIHDS